MSQRCVSRALLAAGVLLAAGGCDGLSRGGVSGRVTVNNEPLQEGQISFVPLDAALGPTAGAAIGGGEYKIELARGPVAGEYQVQINAFRKTGKKTWDGMGDENAPASKKNYVEVIDAFIPAKYNTSSELRATIKAGAGNLHNFDLTVAAK